MGILQKLSAYFRSLSLFGRNKKQEEWGKRFGGPVAKPDNLTPLDPDDPSIT